MSEILDYRVNATVDRAFRHPRGSFTVYRVIIEKSSPTSTEEFTLFKRYSDFKRLHKSLQRVVKDLEYGVPLPSLPPEPFFNRLDPEVVESRRVFLDSLLKVICSKEWLFCHQTFAKFIIGGVVRRTALSTSAPAAPLQDIPNHVASTSFTDIQSTSPVISPTTDISSRIERSSPVQGTSGLDLGHLSPASSSDEEKEEETGTDVLQILWACSPPSTTEWSEAYMAYKSAVADLSNSLQSETCSERRHECRQIIAACLNRAEDLYRRYILPSTAPATRNGIGDGMQESWLSRACPQTISSLCQDSRLLDLLKPKEYLKELRVCRIEGTQLVVRHLNDRTLEYCLEPLHMTSYHDNCSPPPIMTACVAPATARPNCILPLDETHFMLRLCSVVETQECIFLLTERARGPRFFDWFQCHIERQFAAEWHDSCLGLTPKHAVTTTSSVIRHIAWCRLRSARIRRVLKSAENVCVDAGHDMPQSPLPDLLQSEVRSCLAKPSASHLQALSGPGKIDTTASTEVVTFQPLELLGTVTPSDLLQFHPYYPSRMFRTSRLTRGLSLDRGKCSLSDKARLQQAAFEGSYESSSLRNLCAQPSCDQALPGGSWIPLIPERQLRLWASELVYAVFWLHERGVILRTLCRSDVYLGPKGRLKLRYFYAWPANNLDHRGVQSPSRLDYSLAPELRLGVSMHHLLVEQCQSQSPPPPPGCRMPNEQKRALFACDWWSVGVLLYELFTGLELYEAYPAGLSSEAHLDFPPHLPSTLSSLLSSVGYVRFPHYLYLKLI
ncbi:hypothetical protein AAHC03_01883 [Spirometra sp. Aus1]